MLHNDKNVRIRMYDDIGRRTVAGTWVYAIAWPFIFESTELHARFGWKGWALEAFFIAIALLRMWFFRARPQFTESREFAWRVILFPLSLINITVWGAITSYAMINGSTDLVFVMTISVVGFAAGGVNNFAPYLALCRTFLLCALLPMVLAVLMGAYNIGFLVIVVMFISYMLIASKHQNTEYWLLLSNESTLREQQKMLDVLSRTDALTGLYNRRHFNEKFEESWLLCSRQKAPLSMLALDIDHFKKINDTHGHGVGDECLKFVSECLRVQVHRSSDLVARVGGEEFAVLLPFTDEQGAFVVAEAIRQAIAKVPFKSGERVIPVTISIGVVCEEPQGHDQMSEMLNHADQALYQSKHAGRNRSSIYHGEIESSVKAQS